MAASSKLLVSIQQIIQSWLVRATFKARSFLVRFPPLARLLGIPLARPARIGGIFMVGLGVAWPLKSHGPEVFEAFVRQSRDCSKPGVQKVLSVNRKTGIKRRGLLLLDHLHELPAGLDYRIEHNDAMFRRSGTELAVSACKKALAEWGGRASDITHLVAVTCTNAGSPGFDLPVAIQLGLATDVERMLLHGVGCAGGLAMVRAAAQLLIAATHEGRTARVLICACETPSMSANIELEAAERQDDCSIGSVLFSDGAAAIVLTNELQLSKQADDAGPKAAVYELLDWATMRVPETDSLMSFFVAARGFVLHLSRQVPQQAASCILPAFNRILSSAPQRPDGSTPALPEDFDWALHPGGLAVIDGAEKILGLGDDQLRASRAIYGEHGNSSSVAVLAVLDALRGMGRGRDAVVACAFGPGLNVEMAMLKRVRDQH